MEHRSLLPAGDRVHVRLIGCGGNGSQMLTGLARLNHAVRALGHPGLHVTAIDPDAVSPSNIGRQLFAPADVGHPKSTMLVHRLNSFFGIAWDAEYRVFRPSDGRCHLLITCVDSRSARREIDQAITTAGGLAGTRTPTYWMDLGNRQEDGQVIIGCPASNKKYRALKTRLPTVAELLPEIIKPGREDNAPSCSLAEALERQHLFVNQSVVTPALQMLWQLMRAGVLDWHGTFINLRTGRTSPLPVDPAAWARLRGTSRTTTSKGKSV